LARGPAGVVTLKSQRPRKGLLLVCEKAAPARTQVKIRALKIDRTLAVYYGGVSLHVVTTKETVKKFARKDAKPAKKIHFLMSSLRFCALA
jgi:hypothetical protein